MANEHERDEEREREWLRMTEEDDGRQSFGRRSCARLLAGEDGVLRRWGPQAGNQRGRELISLSLCH